MRPRALALVAALAIAAAAHAQVRGQQEDLRATRDSAYIQRMLAQPFPRDPRALGFAIETLRLSGNGRDADLLDRARKRAILASLAGKPFEYPATAADAIEREATAPPWDEALTETLGLVRAAVVPGSVRIEPEHTNHTGAHVDFEVHNGLAVTLRRLFIKVQPAQPPGATPLTLACTLDGPEALAPGATGRTSCHGSDLAERIGPAMQALAEGKPPPSVWFAGSVDSGVSPQTVTFEERTGSGAHEALVEASCEDKGTCRLVSRAREVRADEESRKHKPSRYVFIAIALAFVAGIVAARRIEPSPRARWPMSALATAVSAFAAFGAAVLYGSSRPEESGNMLWLLLYAVLFYGALPWLVGLVAVIASVASGRGTRWQAFSAAFGVGMALVVAGLLRLA